MKKSSLLILPIALGAALALSSVPTPAGACSIFCMGETADLSEPTIVVLEGDPNAATLDWSGDAYIEADFNGTVFRLSIDGEEYYPQLPAEILTETEEVE